MFQVVVQTTRLLQNMYSSTSDTALQQQLAEQLLNLHAIDIIVRNLEHSTEYVSSI